MTALHNPRYVCVFALGLLGSQYASYCPAQAIPVTVSGTINYTGLTGNEANDSANGTALFPARGVRVEIWDANSVTDERIGLVWTNNSGAYSATVEAVDSEGLLFLTADVYIKVLSTTQPPSFIPSHHEVRSVIGSDPSGDDILGNTYSITSPTTNNITTPPTINQNFGASGNAARAFSVFDAVQEASLYYTSLPGSITNFVDTAFPTNSSTSNFSNSELHILQGDRHDWDVAMHEYGHYVQSLHPGIDNSPGGGHGPNNLRFSRGPAGDDLNTTQTNTINRQQADQLAWGEGWATYFGISGQQQMNSAAHGIQRVGDTNYHDNLDTNGTSLNIRYGVENGTIGFASRGEDNEIAVSRILYDLYDSTNETAERDRVALGDVSLWNLVRNNTTATLDTFWDALIALPSITNTARINFGAIFQAHNVSPAPNPASVNGNIFLPADMTPPTFSWAIPQGGMGSTGFTTNLLNNFGVKIFASDDTEVWDSGLLGNVTSWTPAAGDWFLFTQLFPDDYRWITYGQMRTTETINVTTPFTYTTGNFWSDALFFSVIPEPATWALLSLALGGVLLCGTRRNRENRFN